ncbi:MAG: tRNA guanosine(34) transglycosylase Tgt [Candidatus Krumholzibacteria bacterium]|nr:tRNA guanosine(34) transglycosylase Tgt [Candidatus Krumholzibacteria bacterium]MDH4335922.1 tRNA guanosine(34) transglycosylase Tgt [Candidatus Krumholzibacteria bacterium]MDH5268502.1 tRNA guanosine(34) transglycosylase Tgt [Candidatus Krumholzibacteria bacterium]
MPFAFRLEATSHGARAGTLITDHCELPTPVFMPVGTQGTVKGIAVEGIRATGARIILGNTYHLVMRPGVELIESAGGLHRFIGWDGAILTDSGGYQVFSLPSLRRVSGEAVTFRSHIDGSLHVFSPEAVMEAQARIGADIMMSFDYFSGIPSSRAEAENSVRLTTAWARRGRDVNGARFNRNGYEQVVFGIVQGAEYPDLRERSANEIAELDFPGYAVGGLSVGESKDETWDMAETVTGRLPADRPRYLMGMGTPLDLVEGVARGVDMFDCVLPTRNARNGTVFTRDGKVVLKNSVHARDLSPLDAECACDTCRNHSRAYLRHLFQAGEMLGPMLATRHNLHFYADTMRAARAAIVDGTFDSWKRSFTDRFTRGGNGSVDAGSENQRRTS